MGNYRTRVIEVDAEQITGRNVNVSTPRGLITARDGSWLIHDALGVAEVLDGETFAKRYEAIPEAEVTPAARDAPREDVPATANLASYLTGETGRPGEEELTESEAREASKEPEKTPVVGSTAPIKEEDPPKNRGGRRG